MKKTVALLLALLLLSSACPAAFAGENAAAEPAAEALAFAAAMSFWSDPRQEPEALSSDAQFVWEAAGWYAAWLYHSEGIDLVGEEQLRAVLRALGYRKEAPFPGDWETFGSVRALRSQDGSLSYDFMSFKQNIDLRFDRDMDAVVLPVGDGRVLVMLTERYDDGRAVKRSYSMRFEADPGNESIPLRLREVKLPDEGPELDAAMEMLWADILKANALPAALKVHPVLHLVDADGVRELDTWAFLHGDAPTLIYQSGHYISGRTRSAYFLIEDETVSRRPVVSEFNDRAGTQEAVDMVLLNYLTEALSVTLDRVEDGLLLVDFRYSGGYWQKAAFDRETLILREADFYSGTQQPPSRTLVEFPDERPLFDFLDSWNGELRSVRLVWEDFVDGKARVRREDVRLPSDWEYMPYEGRWGDYTVYMNEEYTEPYEYPGDGTESYTLYLTTAKG